MRGPAQLQPMLRWTLLGVFTLRVIGQVYVGLYGPGWLMRWLHGTNPIAFHRVLAGYIAALSIPTKARSHI